MRVQTHIQTLQLYILDEQTTPRPQTLFYIRNNSSWLKRVFRSTSALLFLMFVLIFLKFYCYVTLCDDNLEESLLSMFYLFALSNLGLAIFLRLLNLLENLRLGY